RAHGRTRDADGDYLSGRAAARPIARTARSNDSSWPAGWTPHPARHPAVREVDREGHARRQVDDHEDLYAGAGEAGDPGHRPSHAHHRCGRVELMTPLPMPVLVSLMVAVLIIATTNKLRSR